MSNSDGVPQRKACVDAVESVKAVQIGPTACPLTPYTLFYGGEPARIPAPEAVGLQFWLLTFAEHGLFLEANLPCDRKDLVSEARRFSEAFYAMLGGESRDRNGSSFEAMRCAESMLRFLEQLMNMAAAGELLAHLPPSVLLHMANETRRFIMIAGHPDKRVEPLGVKEPRLPLIDLLDAEDFWLNDQAEHAQMLQQAVDPVHGRYMDESRAWEELLTRLGKEAGSLRKTAQAMPPKIPAACRFTRNAAGATVGHRDFAWDTYRLRNTGQLLGNQPALLAYHMARESEHARLIIEVLAKSWA